VKIAALVFFSMNSNYFFLYFFDKGLALHLIFTKKISIIPHTLQALEKLGIIFFFFLKNVLSLLT